MKAKEFYSELLNSLKSRKDIIIKKYKLKYPSGKYDFLRIASKKIGPEDRVILIRAGIHGNEIAGPLTISYFCNEIIDYLHHWARLKCIIYPLANPSAFELGRRYNIDSGDKDYNDDFLRYELDDGDIVGDIGKSNEFKEWHWSSEPELKIKLQEETQLMRKLLKKDFLPQIAAVIDLHQDCLSGFRAAAYHYAFGDLSRYKKIVEKIKEVLPVLADTDIGAGENSLQKSDDYGFIVRHDGTLPDLMFRLGVEHCIAVETTKAVSLRTARIVNLIWIFGIADLVKEVI